MGRSAKCKPLVRIEDWSVVDDVVSPAYRDLAVGYRLTGMTSGDRNLPCGLVYTSAILGIDPRQGLVETGNAVYQLGEIDRHYERWLVRQSLEVVAA